MDSQFHAHDHREHAGASLADAARDSLESAGEKWTTMRASVFDAMAGFSRPASAYDIADAVSQARGRRVAPNSIYRILDLFVENNLALRVESANAYLANSHPGCSHDCIFLVCDDCGEATHVDHDDIAKTIRDLARASDFEPERPIIEVRGLCSSCR